MTEDGVHHIHAHWATLPTTAAYLCALWLDRPFSFTAHAWDIFVKNRSLAKKIELAAKRITCTEYNRSFLSQLCPESKDKIFLNYHGVDVQKFSVDANERLSTYAADVEGKKGKFHFLSIGRLVESKGYETLIDAYALLRRNGVDYESVIVGSGPLRKSLQKRIYAYGLNDMVKLRTEMPQDQLRDLYRKAFVFVMASIVARNGDRDGIPNVLFEAMAMSVPVIVTSISGIPEAVTHRRTGLVVPPKDPQHLADAITELMQDPALARKLGRQGRSEIESRFHADVHMQQLIGCMRSLAGLSEQETRNFQKPEI
jgi:glycosyltransferase involved in cell wall biosynthesis